MLFKERAEPVELGFTDTSKLSRKVANERTHFYWSASYRFTNLSKIGIFSLKFLLGLDTYVIVLGEDFEVYEHTPTPRPCKKEKSYLLC